MDVSIDSVVVRGVVVVSVNALLVEIVAVVSAPTKVIAAEETRHGPALTPAEATKAKATRFKMAIITKD